MKYCIAYPYLGESIRTKKPVPDILAETIIERSLQYFDIPKRIMVSKIKRRTICEARQMIMVALTEYTKLSQGAIAKMLGRKDHTTVLHAKRLVKDLCDTDADFRNNYNDYLKYLNRA